MTIPRLSYFDQFFLLQDGVWIVLTPEEIVNLYNQMVERYEVILDDIEEIICGVEAGTNRSVHSGTDAGTERAIG